MERDAVSAGVSKIGGLFSIAEIRILICYLLSAIDEPIPGRQLADTLHYEGIANVFEVNDSIAYLCKSGHLKPYNEKEDTYTVTQLGKDCAKTLQSTLSSAVKERAYTATIRMFARFKNAKETDIDISNSEDGSSITCAMVDNGVEFMSIKLLMPKSELSATIKDNFLDNAPQIYSTLIDMLTKKLPIEKKKNID